MSISFNKNFHNYFNSQLVTETNIQSDNELKMKLNFDF